MRIVYLESARDDLLWARRHYEEIFAEGHKHAQRQFHRAQEILASNPLIGHVTHRDDVREFSIPRTPFALIYRVREHRIEVLRIWDERRGRSFP